MMKQEKVTYGDIFVSLIEAVAEGLLLMFKAVVIVTILIHIIK